MCATFKMFVEGPIFQGNFPTLKNSWLYESPDM